MALYQEVAPPISAQAYDGTLDGIQALHAFIQQNGESAIINVQVSPGPVIGPANVVTNNGEHNLAIGDYLAFIAGALKSYAKADFESGYKPAAQ